MATRAEATKRLAAAIKHLCSEHGRPNTFWAQELAPHCWGVSVAQIRRIGRETQDPKSGHFAQLYEALGGGRSWGSAPVYHRGRFHV